MADGLHAKRSPYAQAHRHGASSCQRRDLTRAMRTPWQARPRKKGQDRARCAGLITIVKMIGARVIEIDRLFYQAQPQYLSIKIQVGFGVTGDGGYVV